MPLKTKHIISLIIASLAVIAFGYMKKIMHQPSADLFLKIGFYSLIVSLVMMMIKVLMNKDKDSFLNK